MSIARVFCAVLLLHVAYAASKVHVRGHSVHERSDWSTESTDWSPPPPPPANDEWTSDSSWTYPPTNGNDKTSDSSWTYPPTNSDSTWTDPPTNGNDKTSDSTWTYPPTNGNDKTSDSTWTYPPTNSDADGTHNTEPPTDGTEDTTEPPTDGTEDTTEPLTDGTEDTTELPTDGTEDTTEPPTDGTEDTTELPTDGTEDTTELPTDGTEDTTELPTDGTEDTAEPPTDGTEDTTELPTDGTEDTTEPPTDGTEDTTEPPTDGTEDTTELPTDGTEDTTEPPTDGTEDTTEPPTDDTTEPTEVPTEPPTDSSEDSTQPPTDGDDGTTEPPTEDGTTEPPTESTTQPPATTSAPTCVLTTLTYSSAKTPKYFLNGASGSVTLTAAYTGDPNVLQFVEFKVGTKSIGKVTPDKAKDGSLSLVYKVTSALDSPEVTATPTLKSGGTGPAVKVSLPLLEVPQWALNFLFSHDGPQTLGSFDKWQRSISQSIGFSQNSSSKFNIPFVGFATYSGWNVNYYASIANTGVASAGGSGNVDFKVESNLIPLFSGAAFSTGVSTNFITAAQPNGIYTLTFDSFGISAMGTVKLKMPLSFKKGFTIGPYEFTASVTVPVSFKLGIELTYGLDLHNSLFGLPLTFRGISGTLTATAAVTGSVKVFTSSAALYGSVGITPKIGWLADKGFQFEGVTVSLSVQVDIELSGVKMPSISIVTINPKYFTDGAKRKRDDLELKIDESEIVARQDVAPESYANVWNPTIKSKEPLVIGNAYPSKQLALAEASGVQVIAFSSFDGTQAAPGDQQVEFAWRNASAGGAWSALLFATSSASLPVANPALAGLADGSGVLVVAIQNTNPGAALEAMTMRLVACKFDVRMHLFSAWQAVAAPADATAVYSDWMPVLSSNSVGLMWKRVTLSTDDEGNTTTSTAILYARYGSAGFNAPLTVLSGDAAKAVSAFAMDADDAGGAVMAYVTGDDSSVMVCTLKGGASAWKCLGTRLGFTDGSGGSVVVSYAPAAAGSPSSFAIAFNRETMLYAVRISSSGVLASALWTSDLLIYPTSLAISECALLGEAGSAVVSFTTSDVDGAGFGYAVIAADGSIHNAPSAWLNASASGMGAGTPQSLATLCARTSLYFAASVRDDSGAHSVGTLTVTELPYEADAALYALKFSPANFDISAGGAIGISVDVVNLGMEEYPAGRTVQFVLSSVSGSGKSSETQIGTAKTSVALQSGDVTTLSISWTPTGKTGVLIARLTSADANSTNNVVSADPCSVVVGVPQLTVSAGNVAITVDMWVQGYCAATYPLIATARPDRLLGVLGSEMREMQKEIGRKQFTLTNQEWRTVTIPVTNMTNLDSVVSVSVTGAGGVRSHAEAQLPQDLYDFYFDAEGIAVKQLATGGVNVRITLGNRGLRAAPAVSVRAWLVFEDGTQRKVAEKKVAIGALARKYVKLLLPLDAQINSVVFVANEDLAYPEAYVINNNLTHTIEVVGGAIDGGWATGTAAPAPAGPAPGPAPAAGSGSGVGPAPSAASASSSGKSTGPAPAPAPNAAGSKSGAASASASSASASASSSSSSSSGVALHHGALIGASVVAGVLLLALAGGVVAYALYTRNREERMTALASRTNNDGL